MASFKQKIEKEKNETKMETYKGLKQKMQKDYIRRFRKEMFPVAFSRRLQKHRLHLKYFIVNLRRSIFYCV